MYLEDIKRQHGLSFASPPSEGEFLAIIFNTFENSYAREETFSSIEEVEDYFLNELLYNDSSSCTGQTTLMAYVVDHTGKVVRSFGQF